MEKVSIICLCYNQADFVEDSIHSVLSQTYPEIELIIVDDGSSDNSVEVIKNVISAYPEIKFYPLDENRGNCAAFNYGWKKSSGDFYIDLAADDILLPEKVEKQVQFFNSLDNDYGVIHHNVEVVNEKGEFLWDHFSKVRKLRGSDIQDGMIFHELISGYLVSAPSMMFKREVLEDLEGYDENLSYEDFDFWIRSSYRWKYAHQDEVLMKVRKIRGSMGDQDRDYKKFEKLGETTLKVCHKAVTISDERIQPDVMLPRIQYELRQCFKFRSVKLAGKWIRFAEQNGYRSAQILLMKFIFFIGSPLITLFRK